MDTASFSFVLFGLVVAAICSFRRSAQWRSGILLISSLLFLWLIAGSAKLLIPFAGFLFLGYAGLIAIRRGLQNAGVFATCVTIAAFIWLKKYAFLPHSILLNGPYPTTRTFICFLPRPPSAIRERRT